MLPPGPSAPPAVQTLGWLTRPVSFLEDCRRRFGDAFSVTFVGFRTPMVMVSDPAVIRAVYSERTNGLPPGRALMLEPLVGARSLLLLEGSEHLARRKLMLPPFHGERMRAYEQIVADAVRRDLESWPRGGEAFALHPHMQAVTLDVILRAVFGVSDAARHARLSAGLSTVLAGTSSLGLQLRVVLARTRKNADPLAPLRPHIDAIDGVLADEIAHRRRHPGEDILSLLTEARFEDGEPMSDREIRDQLLTLLLAGHETTATALAWTVDLLLRHPAALARLTDELDAGDDTYLRAVIAESLRLRPVVPIAGRRLATDLETENLSLPAGTDVTPAIWLTHTRPDLYPEPYAFRPERFLAKAPSTYAWIPYGGGVRRCLGAAFAEMEMRVALTEILRTTTLRPATDRAERPLRRNVTLSPRNGTRIHADARVPAEPSDSLVAGTAGS